MIKFASPDANDIYFALFIPSFLPWFAAGAVFYGLYMKELKPVVAFALLVPLLVIIVRYNFLDGDRPPIVASAAAGLMFATFWLIARRNRFAVLLVAGPLVWVGACSYSIYLIHFEIGMVFLSSIPKERDRLLINLSQLRAGRCDHLVGRVSYLPSRIMGKSGSWPLWRPSNRTVGRAGAGGAARRNVALMMAAISKYVINLEDRTDRRAEMEQQLRRVGWQAAFVAAIRPVDAGDFPSVGARGCFLSHLATLKQAGVATCC